MNISKLYIKINLDGDITGTINEYRYTVNTDPADKLGKKSIYIPSKYLLNKKILNSTYGKNPKFVFQDQGTLRDILNTLPKSIIKESKEKYNTKSGPSEIISNNIKLIISLFFPRNSFFYIKGKKFIIRNKNIDYEINPTDNDTSNLLTYDKLEDILFDKLQDKESKRLIKEQEKYQKYLLMLDKTDKDILKREHKILNYNNEQLEAKAKLDTISLLSGIRGSKLINNFGEKKVKEMNDDLRKKGNSILYKYVKDKGIQFIEDKSKGVHCTLTLYLFDSKSPYHSELKHSCKTRKRRIKELYNEILNREKLPPTATMGKPKYIYDSLTGSLFTSNGDYALGHKIPSYTSSIKTKKISKNSEQEDQNSMNKHLQQLLKIHKEKLQKKKLQNE